MIITHKGQGSSLYQVAMLTWLVNHPSMAPRGILNRDNKLVESTMTDARHMVCKKCESMVYLRHTEGRRSH